MGNPIRVDDVLRHNPCVSDEEISGMFRSLHSIVRKAKNNITIQDFIRHRRRIDGLYQDDLVWFLSCDLPKWVSLLLYASMLRRRYMGVYCPAADRIESIVSEPKRAYLSYMYSWKDIYNNLSNEFNISPQVRAQFFEEVIRALDWLDKKGWPSIPPKSVRDKIRNGLPEVIPMSHAVI